MSRAHGFLLESIPMKIGAGMTFLEAALRFYLTYPNESVILDSFSYFKEPNIFLFHSNPDQISKTKPFSQSADAIPAKSGMRCVPARRSVCLTPYT